MSKEFTKNHIVPVRYLKRFATDNNGKRVVGVRYRHDGTSPVKLFKDNIENVGYIKDYYDSIYQKDIKHWEHFFTDNFDCLCGKELETIISVTNLSVSDAVVLNDHYKDILSKIIMCQLLRIPSTIDHMSSLQEMTKASLKDKFKEYQEKISKFNLSDEQLKELFFTYVFSDPVFKNYTSILKSNTWIVYYNINYADTPFVTSDNPVLVENLACSKTGLFNNGLSNNSTCIFFPLTPSIAIAIYSEKGIIGVASDTLDGRKKILNDDKFVLSKNYRIIDQAYHYSFFPLSFFDSILKT